MSIRRTFPGAYTQVVDRSFGGNPRPSRFKAGLLGPASKGPFDVPTPIRTQREFGRVFGKGLSNSYLSNAVTAVSSISDGAVVVRVGQRYRDVGSDGSGAKSATVITTSGFSTRFNAGDYIRVRQIGKSTTTSAQIGAVNGSDLPLVGGATLADDYTTATISRATSANAANDAEAFLYGTEWASALAGVAACSINPAAADYDSTIGTKNFFRFRLKGTTDVVSARSALTAGGGVLVRLSINGKATSRELRIKEIEPGTNDVTVTVDTVDNSKTGTKALPLQDTYGYTVATGASISVKSGNVKKLFHMFAKSPGTWANSDGISSGVWVTVLPGSNPDTKKIQIFEDGGIAETFDNLSNNPASADFIVTRLAESTLVDFRIVGQTALAVSAITRDAGLVTVAFTGAHSLGSPGAKVWLTIQGCDLPEVNGTFEATVVDTDEVSFTTTATYTASTASSNNEAQVQVAKSEDLVPANTIKGWGSGVTTVNFAAFSGGANGENLTDDNYVGEIDPVTEVGTGLTIFEDTDNVNVNYLWCSPLNGAGTPVAVWQKLAEVAEIQNASAVIDGDKGLTPRAAIDYTNAVGAFSARTKLLSYRLSFQWNWFKAYDSDMAKDRWLPPSIGKLRAVAYTYDNFKPWYAAAGDVRGTLPDVKEVEYPTISNETKNRMYGGGQCVNVILKHFEKFQVWGNHTCQREGKLAAEHAVQCANHLMKTLSEIGRRYVFDPNDAELLLHLDMEYRNALKVVKDERGIEDFNLQIDSKNNTAEVRNRREVIVDLNFVPVDSAERIFVQATVRESGAVLNSVS